MTILDQESPSAQTWVYASFGERLVARLIDGIILFIPSIFIPFILPWLYFALLEGSEKGATVGKRAMGIRVLSTDGKPIGFGTATGRFIGNFLNLLTLFIGYLVMLFNAKNQCLHDMLTSTVVVRDPGKLSLASVQNPPKSASKRSWANKISEKESHFLEIHPQGGRYWHRTENGEETLDFTLWQLTDDMVDFSAEFGRESVNEMKQFAEHLLRTSTKN